MSGGVLDLVSAWDTIAAIAPDRVAQVCSRRRSTWAEFADRARRLAWHLALEAKLAPGDRVAIAVENHVEYLETFYAALKLGCVPVNVDARHDTSGVRDVLDHSDAKAVVHSTERTQVVRTAAKRIPKPWRPLLLATGEHYERALASAPPAAEWQPNAPSADDLILIYTGGTTDPTTAVVWRSGDLLDALKGSPPSGGSVSVIDSFEARAHRAGPTVLPVASLTHTLGLFAAMEALLGAGTVSLVTLSPFEPPAVWDAVERDDVAILSVGSETSVSKLTDVLRAEPARWNLSSLRRVVASVALPGDTRHTLAEFLPTSEIVVPAPVARTVGERFRVVDDVTGVDVEPGSGAIGALAVGGANPIGYFKDPSKTAAQVRTITGSRFWLSGEHATVDREGVIRTSAAGTTIIVVDGLSVSAPLVEAVLRKHVSVSECVVVGVPDPRSGERLVALVQVVDDHHLDEAEMTAWCRSQLSAPETPNRFLFVSGFPLVGDRVSARRVAMEALEREPG